MSGAASANEALLGAGEVLGGRYEVEAPIGAGAFGCVYRGRDRHSGRVAAIKVLRPVRAASAEVLRRVESRELGLLARVRAGGGSAHVVGLLEPALQWHGALPFFLLELVEGPSLRERLAAEGPLAPEEAARIGLGMARGLAAIHAAGGVHRDLKPSNVRLRGGREPVLVDLGIARALWETQVLTRPGASPMTMRYAAPEQLAGRGALPAADVYALGLCLHEMLTGEVPLAGESAARTLSLREGAAAPDPRARRREVPEGLAAIVRRCLDAAPARRPSARGVAEALESWLGGGRPARARWIQRGAAAALALLLPGAGNGAGGAAATSAAVEAQAPGGATLWSQRRIEGPAGGPDVEVTLQAFEASGEDETSVARLPALDGLRLAALGPGGEITAIGWEGESCRRLRIERRAGAFKAAAPEACPLPRPRPMTRLRAGGGFVTGDADGDGSLDVLSWGERPGGAGRPRVAGVTWLGAARGEGALIDEAFDLTEVQDYANNSARRLADVDGDGCADLVVWHYSSGGISPTRVFLLSGDCRGRFSPAGGEVAVVPGPGNGGDLADLDGDGLVDLLLGPDDDGDPGRVWMLRGTGLGFGEPEEVIDVLPAIEEGQDRGGHGFAFADDWNGDGHLDALVLYHRDAQLGPESRQMLEVFPGDGAGGFTDGPAISLQVSFHAGLVAGVPRAPRSPRP